MQSIQILTLEELSQFLITLGQQSFRAKQIFKWIYEKKVCDWDLMTDLNKAFRDQLNDAIDKWMKENYGLDLIDFNDREKMDWSIFKQRPYFEHPDADKMNNVSDELDSIIRNNKHLVGHKSRSKDQI